MYISLRRLMDTWRGVVVVTDIKELGDEAIEN